MRRQAKPRRRIPRWCLANTTVPSVVRARGSRIGRLRRRPKPLLQISRHQKADERKSNNELRRVGRNIHGYPSRKTVQNIGDKVRSSVQFPHWHIAHLPGPINVVARHLW